MAGVVKNLWGITEFYCSYRHSEPIKMVYKQGPTSMFYSCPHYYVDSINRPNDRSCTNRLSFDDAEAIVLKLSDLILEKEENGETADFTNFTFKYKSIEITVIKYSLTSIHLLILNRRALR